MLIGHNPPFLVKNLTKHSRTTCKNPIEPECSYFCIQDTEVVRGMLIKAFIHSRNTIIPKIVRTNEPIATFSCFDEIHLFLYYFPNQRLQTQATNENQDQQGREINNDIISFKKDNKHHIFYTKINCCRSWERKQIKVVELDLITESSNYINISVSITNARDPNDYHYNVCHAASGCVYMLTIGSQSLSFPSFQCPLCFRLFKHLNDMKYHISYLHIRYELDIEGSSVFLKRAQGDMFAGLQITRSSANTFSSMQGIEFYNKALFDEYVSSGEDSARSYIDFYIGVSAENEESNNETEMTVAQIENSTGNLVNRKFKCGNYLTERSLVAAIFNAKRSGKKDGIVVYLLQLKPLIKEGKGQNQFKSTTNAFSASIFDDTAFLSQKYLKKMSISFIKKRKTKLFEYRLQNYGLLIEREFDTIDYSGMLSKHLNLRIKEHLLTVSLSPKIYKLMKDWNSIYIEKLSIEKTLCEIVSSYGMVDEIIELIELLYTRGILNSEEIMKILNRIQQ